MKTLNYVFNDKIPILYLIYTYVYINPASPKVAPSNFIVIDTTSTSVTFQWDALSDQQANGVIQQYVITCTERNANTEVIKIMTSHVSLYLNSGLITIRACVCMLNNVKLLLM